MKKAKELKKSAKDVKGPKVPQEVVVPVTGVEEEGWSKTQQAQFEKGLKSIAKDDPNRWERIAGFVEGKSKKECIARFKEIRRMLQEAKADRVSSL
jgi:hypothetical protein